MATVESRLALLEQTRLNNECPKADPKEQILGAEEDPKDQILGIEKNSLIYDVEIGRWLSDGGRDVQPVESSVEN